MNQKEKYVWSTNADDRLWSNLDLCDVSSNVSTVPAINDCLMSKRTYSSALKKPVIHCPKKNTLKVYLNRLLNTVASVSPIIARTHSSAAGVLARMLSTRPSLNLLTDALSYVETSLLWILIRKKCPTGQLLRAWIEFQLIRFVQVQINRVLIDQLIQVCSNESNLKLTHWNRFVSYL